MIRKEKKIKSESSPKKLGLFDHVKHIRSIQDPSYYKNLSDEDRKSFNHFMIVRALSMDETMVEDMAYLYQIFDKIPSPQFYTLLISLVPKSGKFSPWIKSKVVKHNKKMLGYVSERFKVPKYQANEYINVLLKSDEGQTELINILQSFGLEEKEIAELFENKDE